MNYRKIKNLVEQAAKEGWTVAEFMLRVKSGTVANKVSDYRYGTATNA
jgi:hypothetical protein